MWMAATNGVFFYVENENSASKNEPKNMFDAGMFFYWAFEINPSSTTYTSEREEKGGQSFGRTASRSLTRNSRVYSSIFAKR